MTAPGRYAANDGSFARSAGGAAARGGVLIAIAIVIGVLLLSQGFDGGEQTAAVPPDVEDAGANGDGGTSGTVDEPDESAGEGEEPTDEPSDEEGGTQGEDPAVEPTTTEAVAVDPPESVKVAVLNGRGEPGLGKTRSDVLIAAGYVAVGVNAASFDNELSRVYYTPGYEDEAKAVATALNGGSSTLDEAPADPVALVAEGSQAEVADFHIFVLLGADEALG